MHADLVRALAGALAAGVLPGYFWACFLCRTSGLGERLAYSTVLSMASVPTIALLLARIADTGVTLWARTVSALPDDTRSFLTGTCSMRCLDRTLQGSRWWRAWLVTTPGLLTVSFVSISLAYDQKLPCSTGAWNLGLARIATCAIPTFTSCTSARADHSTAPGTGIGTDTRGRQ